MGSTPPLNPPIVISGNARVLLHENVVGAFFAGFKRARPDLFVSGSFNVPHPLPPISLPKPGGGTAYIDYRIELLTFGFDIVPADQQFDGINDPFNLAQNEAALYARISFGLAGKYPVPWSDQFFVSSWIKVSMQSTAAALYFSLADVQISIDKVGNASLLHSLNMILKDYLDTLVLAVKLPTNIPLGQLGSVSFQKIALQLDSVDVAANFG